MAIEHHEDDRAKRYNNTKLIVGIVGFIIQIAFLQVVLLTGASAYLADQILGWFANAYISMLIYIVILGIMDGILLFPLDLYSGFLLEHRYSLSNQTFGRWVWEELKGALISFAVVLMPIMLALYYCIRRFDDLWWLPVACAVFLFTIILSGLTPVLIMPLFYKFTPVTDEEISRRLTERAESSGLRVRGVSSFNMSKNTKKANAALTGLGKTRRIILSDTLLDNFTADEIESVFVHELGHHKYRHIWKGLAINVVSIFAALYIVAHLHRFSLGAYGFQRLDDIAALPLLGFFIALYGLIIVPVGNLVSRHFERQADRYEIQETGSDVFISAMNKLASMNISDKTPNPVVEFLFYSHPSIGKRIKMAEEASRNN